MSDLRVDLVLRVEQDHMIAFASSKEASSGEQWKCQCGEHYKGVGALKKGRRHVATEVLAALDEAAVTQ